MQRAQVKGRANSAERSTLEPALREGERSRILCEKAAIGLVLRVLASGAVIALPDSVRIYL